MTKRNIEEQDVIENDIENHDLIIVKEKKIG